MSLMNEIDVVNSALLMIGEDPILTFDDGSKASNTAKILWPQARDEVLSETEWLFARRFAALNSTTVTDLFGFNFAYGLPGDFITAIGLEDEDFDWTLANSGNAVVLLTDDASPTLEYVARITDTSKWDSLFTQMVIFRLGEHLALALAGSVRVSNKMAASYEIARDRAVSANGQNQRRQKFVQSDVILKARSFRTIRPDKVVQHF